MIGTSKNIWGFNPLSVGGCVAWLDAADSSSLTLSGSNVTGWRDKSGKTSNFEISSIPPTYSSSDSSVNFASSSSTYLRGTLSGTYSNNATVFVVASITSATVAELGIVTTFAGNGNPSYVNGVGTSSSFKYPKGIAVTKSGTIYVSDTQNHIIRKITPEGAVTIFAGRILAGKGIEGTTNGTGTNALFTYPGHCVTDSLENLYIADTGNHCIRRITPAGVVGTWAGTMSISGYVDQTGTGAFFNTPIGITISSDDTTLFVTELVGNRVRKIVISGAVVTTVAGSGTATSIDGIGTQASFHSPSSITVDSSGNLYVCDIGSHRIRKITPGGVVSTFAGSSQGSANGIGTNSQFNSPSGITIDDIGNIYVAESGIPRIRKITPAGVVTTFAGSGAIGSTDGVGTNASFIRPSQIFNSLDGSIYLADEIGSIIRKVSTKSVNLLYPQISALGSNAVTENKLMGQSLVVQGLTRNFLTLVGNGSNPTSQGLDIQTYLNNSISYNTPILLRNISTYSGTTFSVLSLLNGAFQTFSSVSSTLVANSSNVSTYNKYSIGGSMNVTNTIRNSLNGKIFEYLVFNSTLRIDDYNRIEYYLARKWNILGNLSNNPYSLSNISLSYFNGLNETEIQGCRLWLDASDSTKITISNGFVTRWIDKVNSNIQLTGTGSTYTTVNNYPVIQFNGTSYIASNFVPSVSMNCVSTNTSNTLFTSFIVQTTFNTTSSSSSPFALINCNSTSQRIMLLTQPNGSITFNGGSNTTSSISGFSQSINTPQILTFSRISNGIIARVNGIQQTTTPIGTFNTRFDTALARLNTVTWRGNIYEIQHYNHDLSTNQIEKVEGYLAFKWGLNSILPSTHTFKHFPPSIQYQIPPTIINYPSILCNHMIVVFSSNGKIKWRSNISSTASFVQNVNITNSGNVYVSYTYRNSSIWSISNSSNQILASYNQIDGTTNAISNSAVIKFSPSGSLAWVLRAITSSNVGSTGFDQIAVDSNDNFYTYMNGGNPTTLYYPDNTTLGIGGGLYLAKFSSAGFREFNLSATSYTGVGVDSNNNFYTSTNVTTATSSVGRVEKRNSTNGSIIWTITNVAPDSNGIADIRGFGKDSTDSNGNLYTIAVQSQRSINVTGNPTIWSVGSNYTLQVYSQGSNGGVAFIVKFSPSGSFLWASQIVTQAERGNPSINSFNVFPNGDIVSLVTGSGGLGVGYNCSFYNSNNSSLGGSIRLGLNNSLALVKYNTSGIMVWLTKIENIGWISTFPGPSNSMYIIGNRGLDGASGTFFYNPGSTIPIDSATSDSFFIVNYSSNGYLISKKTLLWAPTCNTNYRFSVNSSGEVCIAYTNQYNIAYLNELY